MNQATLTMLPVGDIVFDSQQPRKFFDNTAMNELVESVRQNGILQPIMVRPGASIMGGSGKANRKGFIIVCGERRYRAAFEAGLKEIPVVIREGLSDAEVLEIQIIENLQRKDVNSMEEGLAFEKLSKTFTLEEIAFRVGKSAQYVAQRRSLSQLTDNWQQLMYNGEINLTQAYKLARLAPAVQDEGYKEVVGKNGKIKNTWELENIIEDTDHDLSKATFDTQDEDLYPEAGACASCRYNSATSNLLFPDLNKKRICHNSPCFTIKTNKAYAIELEEKAKDPDCLFISASYSPDKEEKAKIKAAQDLGLTVLGVKDYEIVEKPEDLLPWEEFLAAKLENDFDDMDEEEQKEWLRDIKEEYGDDQLRIQEQWKEYNIAFTSGRKAFVVTGKSWRAKGETVLIIPKDGKSKGLPTIEGSAAGSEINAIDTELDGIRTREARNKELDREKVQVNVCSLFENGSSFLSDELALHEIEENALIYAMCEASYNTRHFFEELLGKVFRKEPSLYSAIAKSRGILNVPSVARVFVADKLVNKNAQLDPERYGNAAAILDVATLHYPDKVSAFKFDQAAKATKRQTNTEKRVKALEEKKAQLLEEKTRQENEEAGKKAQSANKKKAKA